MFTLNLGQLNINEAELKAYIYQQLNEIEPYIGNASVAIKMAYAEDEDQFMVKMIFDHEAGSVEAESVGSDIFSTLSHAKSTLIKNVHSLDRAVELDHQEAEPLVSSHVEKKTVH